ncbi:membrane protein [Streptococcus pseudoporcinus]|uniref:Membrane protein n=2 Tax=Streptococcus pseudoporcinus TaxID=361101 RepID=A0A4V6KZE7_9STRE|nr:membrane protein [Streptococcus pseudoporcinus]VUC65173.1 membrane protein [Streptococcus pseudoporcinus]VUC95947.1 membrane protein [Streptococcus pseudoporcinus]VUC96339.1 membrane protein [Streptococcus pseudoporcinus]
MVLLSILTALTTILGKFVSIATPSGFLTLLDAGIYFTAFYLGKREGMIVGALSGFLIDLISGYPNWMFFSLIAHGFQGYFAGLTGRSRILGLVLASLAMVGIYFLATIPMYGLGAAVAGIIGNIGQNFLGMLVGYLVYLSFSRVRKVA